MGKADELAKIAEAAINNPDIPKFYANGFLTGTGRGDTFIVLQQNGQAIAVLNLSFTVAKTLALKLGNAIKDLEDRAQTEIFTIEDFKEAFSQASSEPGEQDADI